MTPDDEFREYVAHVSQMLSLTQSQVINTYWRHIEEIEKNGFVPFVIRGSLIWETSEKKKISSQTSHVWLQSDYYDPVGKSSFAKPVKIHLQLVLNQYDIWGGIQIQVNKQSAQATKYELEQGIRDISLLCNLASLTTQASITWLPAKYVEVSVVEETSNNAVIESASHKEWMCIPLPRRQEEYTSVQVKDAFVVDTLFPLFEIIRAAQHSETAALLRRSIAWHSTGNFLGAGLNRFLNYWESVELLADYFYRKFSPDIVKRPTKSYRKAKILDLLTKQSITPSNCLSIADECANIIRPSIRSKMCAVIPILVGADDFVDRFFEPDATTHQSLYNIRNNIAHGNYCDHDIQFTELVEQRLYDMCVLSRKVIIAAIRRLKMIEEFVSR